MTFPEASLSWNKEGTYVTQQYSKYRFKFFEGTTAAVGYDEKKTFLITKSWYEDLMNETEKEANQWLVRRVRDWTIMSYNQKVDSEKEVRDLITRLIIAELKDPSYIANFEPVEGAVNKHKVNFKKNDIYIYEKINSK
ncbi:MAG: hypothetical protein ACLRPU_01190 [Enterococcus hulanensis]